MSDPILQVCADAADRMNRQLSDNAARAEASKKEQQDRERASWDRADEMLLRFAGTRHG
ncbi:hypothetical protein [Bradyrhizobium sp. Leo170]|uniref:hypothetical protein n=1 Tax=Bradyrhizobium sp. Leo170 TaxID=1571199 RepID=UPI0013EE6673|nr:hypothetical protein [Bradyrhizobium sp. Leo170]